MRRKQIEVAVIGLLIIGIILYAGTGVVYAGALSSSAERTLNTVVSHQNSLNTSFNENEPIVCTPQDALACFLRTRMDLLVMGNWMVRRSSGP